MMHQHSLETASTHCPIFFFQTDKHVKKLEDELKKAHASLGLLVKQSKASIKGLEQKVHGLEFELTSERNRRKIAEKRVEATRTEEVI